MMIGCLTEQRDDVGLWDRYAEHGQGCVLAFDARWLQDNAGVALRRVSYDPSYLHDFVNAGLAMLQSQYEDAPNDRAELIELASMFVLDLYAFKDPRFRSEAEVRVSRLTIVDPHAAHGLIDIGGTRADGTSTPALPVNAKTGRYGQTRFIDVPILLPGLGGALRSVGFGPHVDKAEEARLRNASAQGPALDFWRSNLPLR